MRLLIACHSYKVPKTIGRRTGIVERGTLFEKGFSTVGMRTWISFVPTVESAFPEREMWHCKRIFHCRDKTDLRSQNMKRGTVSRFR
jgi:hypothetical protein